MVVSDGRGLGEQNDKGSRALSLGAHTQRGEDLERYNRNFKELVAR